MSLYYARAFPWEVQVLSSSEVGDGTAFPCKTKVKLTHTIFWETDVLNVTASVLAANETQSRFFILQGQSEARAVDRPQDMLLEPIGAAVNAAGGDGYYQSFLQFRFEADSAGSTNDLREQHLQMLVTGSFGTIGTLGPSDIPPLTFSSISGNGQFIGSCSFLDCDISLYSAVPGGVFLTVIMSVTRTLFTFRG